MERKSERAYKTAGSVFASRLTESMKDRGLNQTHLQAKIFEQSGETLQRQTISLYMNGQSKPDTERLTLLCRALGVSADWLLGLQEVKEPDISLKGACGYTQLSEAAIKQLRSVQPAYQKEIEQLLRQALLLKTLNSLREAARQKKEALNELKNPDLSEDQLHILYNKLRHSWRDISEDIGRLLTSYSVLLDEIDARIKAKKEAVDGEHTED